MDSVFLDKLNKLAYFSIALFTLGDISRKIAIHFNFDFIRFTGASKTIVLLSYVFFMIAFYKKYYNNSETRKLIHITLTLLVVFIIGQIIIKSDVSLLQNLFNNVLFLSRYILWPLSLIVFFPLITNKSYKLEHLS
ncbi:MAG: hypothetical protein DA407_16855, partial [Bacteroidetes bacterium]